MARKAGSKNKLSSVAKYKLAQLNCDPIERAVTCANELYKEGHKVDAGRMYLELINYVAPKLKATEISTDQESPVNFQIILGK